MNRRLLIGIGAVVIVMALALIAIGNAPKPVTPLKEINVLGGLPTFQNEVIAKLLADKYNLKVNVLSNSNLLDWKNKDNKTDFSDVAVIFGGSASFNDELKDKYKDGLPTGGKAPIKVLGVTTIFQSPLVLYVKSINADAFLKSELVSRKDGVYSISGKNMLIIIQAMNEGKYWKDINVDLAGKVRLGYPDPTLSSGGRYALAYIASCQIKSSDSQYFVPCSETVTVDQVPSLWSSLYNSYQVSGKKPGDDNSVYFYYDWANSRNASETLVFAYEAANFSWLTTVIPDAQESARNSTIGIYPEATFMSSQIGVALSQDGTDLIKILTTDQEIIKAANAQLGMRVGFNAGLPKLADWVSQNNADYSITPDPAAAVTSLIKKNILDGVK